MFASSTPVLHSQRLSGVPGVRHGFFTRRGGVSEGIYRGLNVGLGSDDNQNHVAENRRRAAADFGVDENLLLTCRQVHSSIVLDAYAEGAWRRPEADGLVTVRSGVLLGVLSADCAPVLFAAPGARVVAAVHAGWKGALGGVLEAAVEALKARGADVLDIVAAVGPCIGPASYEVGLEFEERFQREDPASVGFFAPGIDHQKRLFDLPGYVVSRLARAGLKGAHWIGRDTFVEPDAFFSHRRSRRLQEPDYGRLLSAILLD
jgi:YfiH family protein